MVDWSPEAAAERERLGYLRRIRELEAAANEVLRAYMPQFNDSRAVDDCLVLLAAAVAGVTTLTEVPKAGSPPSANSES